MRPQTSHRRFYASPLRALVVSALLLAVGLVLSPNIGINTSQAQDQSQENEDMPPGEEKVLEDTIPSKLPIKLKVKNLNRKRWAHELEVEVKNTSNKPIYFLRFHIVLPEIKAPTGDPMGFVLSYGRMELIDFTAPLETNDIPILPGEVYVFRIPESHAKGWDSVKEKHNKDEPKRLRLVFQLLNFGDGTGYADSSASPVDIHRKVSLLKNCLLPPIRPPDTLVQSAHFFLPASFLGARPGRALYESDVLYESD